MAAKQKTSSIKYQVFAKALKDFLHKDNNLAPTDIFKSINCSFPLLITGPEELRLSRLIKWINIHILKDQAENHTYFANQLSSKKALAPLLSSLKAMPLFASLEVHTVYNANMLKTAQINEIVAAVHNPNPNSLLILTAPVAKLKKPLTVLASACRTHIEIPPLSKKELPAWIKKEVKNNGVKAGISKEAIQSLATAYEKDLHSLSHEIAKLALAIDNDKQIDLNLVSSMCSGAPERTSFQLVHLIAQKSTIKASALLKDLLEQGIHPLQLSGFLNRAFRTMLAKKTSDNKTHSSLHNELTNNWFLRNLSSSANLFTAQELEKSVNSLKHLDLKLKGSSLSPETHLESFITEACLRRFI